MKRVFVVITAGLFWGAAAMAAEESVYTWTDSKGVTTLTNRLPLSGVRLKDVTRYQVPGSRGEKTKQTESRAGGSDILQPDIDAAQIKARQAEKKFRESQEAARNARKVADDFKKKIGNNKKRVRKNRSKMDLIEAQAALAEKQARLAEEDADILKKAAGELKSASD